MNTFQLKMADDQPMGLAECFGDEDLFEDNEDKHQDKDGYRVYTGSNPGYAAIEAGGEFPLIKNLSNFYIKFSQWVRTTVDEMPISYYDGELITEDGTTEFTKMPAAAMEDASSFKKYIANLCGTKALIVGNPGEVVKAIKTFNKNVQFFEAQEFGYDESLTRYYTADFTITADKIIPEKTPIKYGTEIGTNKLGFKLADGTQRKKTTDFIINRLFAWDNPLVIYNTMAFTFYPLIYPFLKQKNPNKFFLMLKGSSGAGKSQMSKWMQNFYGTFSYLPPWNSTDTSVNIMGTLFKDALFCVDDLKLQNLKSDKDPSKIMTVLQNYSDGNSRQRANVDLTLKDARTIKGQLMISAEDLVISETSTIARGIIIQVDSKKVKMDELSEISKMSNEFNTIMPYFIQFILRNYGQEKIEKIFEAAHKTISAHPMINDPEISPDNLPRIINNFAALKTSWEVLSGFLLNDMSTEIKAEYQKRFENNLIALMKENIDRINNYKPEIIFETAFWDLVQNGTFSLRRLDRNGKFEILPLKEGKVVGFYTKDTDDIRIIIQLTTAVKEMRGRVENFAISEDALKSKLLKEGKIKTTGSGRFSLNGFKARGVEWSGDFPQKLFGLEEKADPVEEATEILADTENIVF